MFPLRFQIYNTCAHAVQGKLDVVIVRELSKKSPLTQARGMFCILTLSYKIAQPEGNTLIKQRLDKNVTLEQENQRKHILR